MIKLLWEFAEYVVDVTLYNYKACVIVGEILGYADKVIVTNVLYTCL